MCGSAPEWVWLFFRNGVAKRADKCGSVTGIYTLSRFSDFFFTVSQKDLTKLVQNDIANEMAPEITNANMKLSMKASSIRNYSAIILLSQFWLINIGVILFVNIEFKNICTDFKKLFLLL